MKFILMIAALGAVGIAHAQINFLDNHDAGSTFTGTNLTGANPWAMETNGANSHTASTDLLPKN